MKVLKWIAAGFLVISLVWGGICFVSVNRQYPRPTVQEYQIGEKMLFQGYEFYLNDVQMIRFQEFADTYGDPRPYGSGTYAEEYDTHYLMIDLTVTNASDDVLEVPPVFYFTIQSQRAGYSSNLDLLALTFLYNEDLNFLNGELLPGETLEVLLPFSIDANLLTTYDDGLDLDDFIYIITQYPQKNYFVL